MLGATLPFIGDIAAASATTLPYEQKIQTWQAPYLFTKVLQWLPLSDLPQTVHELGFAGIDIAVRSNGHFTVAELKEKLPSLIEASERLGLQRPILTTELTGEDVGEMEEFLRILSGEGIRHYRMGWLKYKTADIMKELAVFNDRFKKLADLHQQYQVQAHYQNHAGNGVGGSVWELLHLLDGVNPQHIGIQYDLRHATVEGYRSWETAFHVIKGKITTLDIKDFRWGEARGKDVPITVPFGQGNVDFRKIMTSDPFQSNAVPKILHVEHELGGAENGSKKPTLDGKTILSAIQKDIEAYKALVV